MNRLCPLLLLLLLLILPISTPAFAASVHTRDAIGSARGDSGGRRVVMDVEGEPRSVVWVVQLSDLHFSVHHPERARDFGRLIPPTLAMINPSLVLITGDLTDGKSKDLLTMKQIEEEWIEYQNVMSDVIIRSGLDKRVFYDIRGNHDQFGVPATGGPYDFYSKYSINARKGWSENVYSITLKSSGRKHLFVGFDSAMDIGLRGPTNLFGHPSEQILNGLDVELSQWNSEASGLPVTKISFGHFPISFSAISEKGRSLKDIFLKYSISAYLCGHLHSRFGINLKRHHHDGGPISLGDDFFQLNMLHGLSLSNTDKNDCSKVSESDKEFWEWEMGDWRKRRAIRIVAIDSGHVSFLDTDLSHGIRKTIVLPTFPLDSRLMQRASSYRDYKCGSLETNFYETVRALVFSDIDIYAVHVKIYDSKPGRLNLVMDMSMKKQSVGNNSRGDLYETPWNWRAFADSSPDRYWLQIEVIDIMGDSTLSQLRPFSINGLFAKVNWTWKEFQVMGVHWGSVFYPILYTCLITLFSILLVPRVFLIYAGRNYMYKIGSPNSKGRSMLYQPFSWFFHIFLELSKLTFVWSSFVVYSLFLTFCPWLSGNIFTEVGQVGYMTLNGWSTTFPYRTSAQSHLGVPDIMVVVLPHLFFVVFPAVLVMSALSWEQAMHRMHSRSSSKKKQDDADGHHEKTSNNSSLSWFMSSASESRRTRKILLLTCLLILWKHWKQCRSLIKAYEINPFFHAPVFCFMLPMLLLYTIYLTGATQKKPIL